MRFSLISAALFASALALPTSYEASNELVARDFSLIHGLPKFLSGLSGKSGKSDPSSDNSNSGDSGSGVYDVKGQIQTLDQDVAALADQVDKFNGDSDDALNLMKAADTLIGHIKEGLQGTESSGKIPFKDGVLILPVFTSFVPDTKKAVANLIQKKDVFNKAGITSVVAQKLQAIQQLGQQFDDAVVSKLDALSKPFGKVVYKPINTSLLDALKQFPDSGDSGAATAPSGGDAASIAAADGE